MKIPFKRAKAQHLLPLETAEHMLANVFTTCGREQNSVPLKTLSSYSNYRKERYSLQRTIIVIVLVLFLLLPLLFLAANVRVTLSNPDSGDNPIYTISVSTRIPIRQIQVQLENRNVPIYEITPNQYMVQPRGNGSMNVTVTLFNHQLTSVEIPIDSVDTRAPQLLSTEADEDYIHLYVTDHESAVDFDTVTITDPDGKISVPVGYDAETGRITLPYPACAMNVRIPDIRGNALQIDLKPEG